VNGICILREQRKPDVVGRNNRAPERMLVNVTHFEILKNASRPTLFKRHVALLR
jgi:hypothetical protein